MNADSKKGVGDPTACDPKADIPVPQRKGWVERSKTEFCKWFPHAFMVLKTFRKRLGLGMSQETM